MKNFFVSTAIPYVNSKPHIGFALEAIQADVIARYRRFAGDSVFYLSGTDENSLKNVLSAKEAGMSVSDFVTKNAEVFKSLKAALNLSWDDFIRTTEERHVFGAQKLWEACKDDIYEKEYKGLYCVGCEEFKTSKDIINGECPEHPNKKLEEVQEKNYFFKLSKYQDKLEKIISSDELKIVPERRKNEILNFIKNGLEDFSVSRSRERAGEWGIPVPSDESQIMYVWFDALSNYINTLGYPDLGGNFEKFWNNGETLHVIGKGINRFHTVYWPAMLLSAGLPLPKKVFVHGYITVDGQKISKSLGNVVDPFELVRKYGTDALRYYLLREISSYEDGDFSIEKFETRYNADLANGIGNLVARVSALGEKLGKINLDSEKLSAIENQTNLERYDIWIENFEFDKYLTGVWEDISKVDGKINLDKPWAISDESDLRDKIIDYSISIAVITKLLKPFLPEAVKKIEKCFIWSEGSLSLKKTEAIFPRL